jgi:hypothetical protein
MQERYEKVLKIKYKHIKEICCKDKLDIGVGLWGLEVVLL